MTERKTINAFKHTYSHSTFGGVIYESDFDTDFGGKESDKSFVADRIISAWNFDQRCLKEAAHRDQREAYELQKGIC